VSYSEITVEGIPELVLTLENLDDAIDNPVEGLLDIIQRTVLPVVGAKSMATWTPRTFHYATSWYVQALSDRAVEIGNQADYALPLETGWTTRAGTFRDSPGVLYPVIEEEADSIAEMMAGWIASKANL